MNHFRRAQAFHLTDAKSNPGLPRRKLRIGINALFQASGGSLTNLLQLLTEWQRMGVFATYDVFIYLSRGTERRVRQVLPAQAERVVLAGADGGLAARILLEQARLPWHVRDRKLDVLFCPGNTMPLWARVPCVVTFQNAAPFSSTICPQSVGWRRWLRFQCLGLFMRWSARRAERIIFGSDHFRELFCRCVPLAPQRTQVIYRTATAASQAAAQEDWPEVAVRYGIRRPYLLSVSHLQPYKNITQLIEGFHLAQQQGPLNGVQLVLVGGWNGGARYTRRIRSLISRLGLTERQVLFTGDVPHRDVAPLQAMCDAFVFSSTCENCPTGLVEALWMGLPIACSRLSSMPEVAGNAVLYFDPYEPADIGRVLTQLFSTPGLKRLLSVRASSRARQLPDQAEMARQTLRVILAATGTAVQSRAA